MGVILSMYHNLLSLSLSFSFLSFFLTSLFLSSISIPFSFKPCFWIIFKCRNNIFFPFKEKKERKERKKERKERKHNLNDIPIHVFQKLIEIFLPFFFFLFLSFYFFLSPFSLLSFLFASLTSSHVYSLSYTRRKKDKEYSFIYFHSLFFLSLSLSLFSLSLKNFLIKGKEG